MLNYLGTGGGMPSGVPGISSPLAPRVASLPGPLAAPGLNSSIGNTAPPLGAVHPMGAAAHGMPPGVNRALPPSPGSPPPPPPPPGPSAMKYKAITQEDGSVVLHLLKHDGKLGPAVKIITPPKVNQGQ